MHGLLMTALHDPSLSQQAAIFHQRQLLQQDAVTTNAPRGTAVKTLNAKLRDSSTVCFSCLTRATLSYSAIRYDSAECRMMPSRVKCFMKQIKRLKSSLQCRWSVGVYKMADGADGKLQMYVLFCYFV